MSARWLAGALALVVAGSVARAQGAPQLGLRLDPVSSMQWSGSRLWVEGQRRALLATTGGSIRDVWPGPRKGAFGVYTDRGVGALLGRDVVLGGRLPAGALARSSRYDAMWVLRRHRDSVTIRQAIAGGAERTILATRGVVDFDVDVRGRLALLVAGDSVAIVPGATRRVAMALPKALAGATRIFVDAEMREIAVYAPGKLARYGVEAGRWTVEPVSEAKEALVRQAWDRRIAIEPKLR